MLLLVFRASAFRERSIVPGNEKHGGRKSVSLKKKKKSLGFCTAGLAVDLAALVSEILATWLYETSNA